MDDIVHWDQLNQKLLVAELARVRGYLEHSGEPVENKDSDFTDQQEQDEIQADEIKNISALNRLVEIFSLSEFERDVLIFCAGVELDSKFRKACAKAQGDQGRGLPTFSLALSHLPNAHWSALSPQAPLRRWRFIEIIDGNTLVNSTLRIDERILHYLAGVDHLDSRLNGLINPCTLESDLYLSQQCVCEQISEIWTTNHELPTQPVVQLSGNDAASRKEITARTCALMGYQLHELYLADIPNQAAECEALARLWEREAAISGCVLLIHIDEYQNPDRESKLLKFVHSVSGLLILSSQDAYCVPELDTITIAAPDPTPEEQRNYWLHQLGDRAEDLEFEIAQLVDQFALSQLDIQSICDQLIIDEFSSDGIAKNLWDAARKQSRRPLNNLVQYIEPMAGWNDIVLPQQQIDLLKQIANHVRQRFTVYETWGFAAKSKRGLGISALFTGLSGTGKTMAAEVLANELNLDLHRIDLSQVISKYIGETTKNLNHIFENKGSQTSILLFDEADALFGKRSEVRDSHDRYANLEVSYLLQKMEEYPGLSILTTNMKNAIDSAFLRRIRFVVQFPFPDITSRAEIWRRIFPAATPTEGLDPDKLAQLNISGGKIRNIAMNAAFFAAEAEESINVPHLLNAALGEYTKSEKTLTDSEMTGLL